MRFYLGVMSYMIWDPARVVMTSNWSGQASSNLVFSHIMRLLLGAMSYMIWDHVWIVMTQFRCNSGDLVLKSYLAFIPRCDMVCDHFNAFLAGLKMLLRWFSLTSYITHIPGCNVYLILDVLPFYVSPWVDCWVVDLFGCSSVHFLVVAY
jgi:hypothetical protein